MKRGLVLGKFMPLHIGHSGLIDFALSNCDELIVLVCAEETEQIDAYRRLRWVQQTFASKSVRTILVSYNESVLPNTSVSSQQVSKLWADFLWKELPKIDVVFTSEKYGDYLAEYMQCAHMLYDAERLNANVSATIIREKPYTYRSYLPKNVQPYFVKKVCICGTESTGKSTLTEKLAQHYNTAFVPEMARDIVEETEACTEQHLQQIALLHGSTIDERVKTADGLLFVDTDLNITKSYSRFLFGKELTVCHWIETANSFDLYLYLDNDVEHVQDGTRLDIDRRNMLHESHLAQLEKSGIKYVVINGSWDERLAKAIAVVDEFLKAN